MKTCLVICGVEDEKVEKCGRAGRKLEEWVCANIDKYDHSMAIIRVAGNRNFNRGQKEFVDDNANIKYNPGSLYLVQGYDLDVANMPRDFEYHICGISTAATVMSIALSMYSVGLNIRILEDKCLDRLGFHKEAIKIMRAYMPECVI